MGASLGVSWSSELLVRQSPASKDVKTNAEEVTAMKVVTGRQADEKTIYDRLL
jgi:hypothetical protein